MKESAEIMVRRGGILAVRGKGVGRGHLKVWENLSQRHSGVARLGEIIKKELEACGRTSQN